MNEPTEHERVVELLKRARLPEEQVTPERREENLRWLIRSTRPEATASEALRQALAAAHPPPPPSPFACVFSTARPAPPRTPAGATPLAAARLVLLLLLTPRAPAQVLARTLRAMAEIRSAHCTGWRVEYRSR